MPALPSPSPLARSRKKPLRLKTPPWPLKKLLRLLTPLPRLLTLLLRLLTLLLRLLTLLLRLLTLLLLRLKKPSNRASVLLIRKGAWPAKAAPFFFVPSTGGRRHQPSSGIRRNVYVARDG